MKLKKNFKKKQIFILSRAPLCFDRFITTLLLPIIYDSLRTIS
jgi:hypothetical protein